MIDEPRPESGHDGCARPRPSGDHGRSPGSVPARGSRLPRRRSRPGFGSGGLSPRRVEGIRWRIAHGAYDSDTVLRVVARRILDRGDLRD